MAKTKQTEAPFSFYARDVHHQQQEILRNEMACEVPDYQANQFRAKIVPW